MNIDICFNALFDNELKRLDLLSIKPNLKCCNLKIAVYRNHSFEMIASVLNSFLTFSELSADFIYSSYDDSLNFQNIDADLNLIWLDVTRYKLEDISSFVNERALALRELSNSPIIFICIGNNLEVKLFDNIPDCYLFSLNDELERIGDSAYDLAKEPYSGTRLSNKASLRCARVIGLQYIPAIFKPNIKAVVLDLDNTLYRGILGEDGISALEPNIELQKAVKQLHQNGIFLCIASKNEEADVVELFKQRTDFALRIDDFTAIRVNWNSKYDNIKSLADELNIGCDAMLFIDDNPAEIENTRGLGLKTILANDPNRTVQTLKYFPGLLKLKKSKEDNIRDKDIRANKERSIMANTLSPKEYFKKLGIKLHFSINDLNQIVRCSELLGKTNQFILNYKRYSELDLINIIKNKGCLITAAMSDNLSDSGIIAVLVLSKDSKESVLNLNELTVSCRALGRHLESIMIPFMFKLGMNKLNSIDKIRINYRQGERNIPALNWLKEFSQKEIEQYGNIICSIPNEIVTEGISIEVSDNG
ncbi:HAD-IIIC family phosphatase [Gilliamella sp. W8126]|uniref:HAD-IIIC family phosphatase n=1 Tax=Gilliamella sp. W8126 TaxID=2750946 RepID=UPI0018DE9E6A|nr:HAD-IIIC family phosphatase [Gilliamella sp. W8126]MBI0005854.1 HAD-IIIC family phosphatase [Gilliamella sp. W8126]